MPSSSIDVAVAVAGSSIPESVVPCGTFIVGGIEYQQVMSGPVPPYDFVKHTWTGGRCTQIVYRSGGSSGTIVCTVDYSYDVDGNLDEIAYTY